MQFMIQEAVVCHLISAFDIWFLDPVTNDDWLGFMAGLFGYIDSCGS